MEISPEGRESLDIFRRHSSIELGYLPSSSRHTIRSATSQTPIIPNRGGQSLDGQSTYEEVPPIPERFKETITNPNRWNGDKDPDNPYNWPLWRVNLNTALLALLAFLSPFSSAVMAPATATILAEFNTKNDLLESFVVSSYVLAVCLSSIPKLELGCPGD